MATQKQPQRKSRHGCAKNKKGIKMYERAEKSGLRCRKPANNPQVGYVREF